MKSLKTTLSVQNHHQTDRSSKIMNSSLLKGVNKSRSHTCWTLDVDDNDQITEQSLQTDKLLRILHDKLELAFKKTKNLNEMTFERIIQEFQDEAGGKKSQLAYLMVIQDKIMDLLQFTRSDLQQFLIIFNEMLLSKMNRQRNKEKAIELNNFQKIASHNFKKKTQHKAVLKKTDSGNQANGSKQKRKANDSIQKLNKLLSIEKKSSKQNELKDQDKYSLSVNFGINQSISFSTALATTATVKSRRRKDQQQLKKQKSKISQQANEQKQQDEAFIFYRPKKYKK